MVMEKEVGSSKKEECTATNSIFNEVKEFVGHAQDKRGRGRPTDSSTQERNKADD